MQASKKIVSRLSPVRDRIHNQAFFARIVLARDKLYQARSGSFRVKTKAKEPLDAETGD
jgi:hypothetical protein